VPARPVRRTGARTSPNYQAAHHTSVSEREVCDGRIDDPDAEWKGRAVWADFGTNVPWHLEGGAGTTSKIVKFQIRPDLLAY
jgi:hypothetical protein